MHKSKKPQDPLKVIESKPYRKSRSETIRRQLMTTSYPHAIIGNLVMDLMKGYGVTDLDQLNATAKDLRESEQELGIFDYIRCVQLRRIRNNITVTAKRMRNVESLKGIMDNTKSHETCMAHELINPTDESLNIDAVKLIATKIVEAFYRAQDIMMDKRVPIDTLKWKAVAKRVENTEKIKSFGDIIIKRQEDEFDYNTLVETLVISLSKPEFNIVILPKILNIHDQSIIVVLK